MATIRERTRKDGGTSYEVQIRLRGHPSHTKAFRRKTDAKRYVQDFESAVRERRTFRYVEATKHTLAETIDAYLYVPTPDRPKGTESVLKADEPERAYAPSVAGKKDLAARERALQWWQAELGHSLLADVTPPVLARIRDRLAAERTIRGGQRAPATVNRLFAYLGALMTFAVKERHWLESNPLRSIKKLGEPRGRVRFLSEAERDALLEACIQSASPDLHLIVVLALSTGARRGEIEGLRWKQIDLARETAVLHDTKNGETRVLHLAGPALKLLDARSKVRRIDTDLVFARADGKEPIIVEAHWRKARAEAGLEDFRFHDLRHSAASYLAMNGATLAEIAAVLGHKTLSMVKRYAHLSDQHTAGVVQRMNAKIFRSS